MFTSIFSDLLAILLVLLFNIMLAIFRTQCHVNSNDNTEMGSAFDSYLRVYADTLASLVHFLSVCQL